eukprot:172391-Chlamydomonas_euryale.AAC.2
MAGRFHMGCATWADVGITFLHAQSSAPVSVNVHPVEESPFTVHRSPFRATLVLTFNLCDLCGTASVSSLLRQGGVCALVSSLRGSFHRVRDLCERGVHTEKGRGAIPPDRRNAVRTTPLHTGRAHHRQEGGASPPSPNAGDRAETCPTSCGWHKGWHGGEGCSIPAAGQRQARNKQQVASVKCALAFMRALSTSVGVSGWSSGRQESLP